MKSTRFMRILLTFLLAALTAGAAFGQGTAFNFQGRLNDGTNPANGRYDLQFRLYNALAGGTQIGAEISRPNTILINGVFSTTLDFGAAAFNNPNAVFIEIGLRPNGSPNAFTILGPRQQLTVVPFAIRATSAANADNATNAVNATNAANATNAVLANVATTAGALGGIPPAGYARLNFANTGDLKTTGDLVIDGNARQLGSSGGMVKAMAFIRVDRSGGNTTVSIDRCFNGITNSSTGNCGITIPFATIGNVDINFGFPIENRFISLTSTVSTDAKVNVFQNPTTVSIFDNSAGSVRYYIYVF